MDMRKAHQIWMEQCKAVHTIKARFGVADAFNYLVGEKLLNFASALPPTTLISRGCCRGLFPRSDACSRLMRSASIWRALSARRMKWTLTL